MRRQGVNTGQRLSPSARKIIKLRQRAFNNGGASLELQIPTNYIRDISRDLNYDITSDASLIMTPNTIGESRLFNCKPELRNLLKYSEEFDNAIWGKNNTSMTENSIANPINGLVDADTFNLLTVGVLNRYIGETINLTSGVYSYSLFIKYKDKQFIQLTFSSGFNGVSYSNFDLINGTITSTNSINSTITNYGNGWYRCSITANLNSGNFPIYIYPIDNGSASRGSTSTNSGTDGYYIWGAQLEPGTTATEYQRTTDGIIDFTATRATTATVIQKDGSVGESCYNLLQRSEEFDNVYWGKVSSGTGSLPVVTPNYATSPIGTNTADRIQLNLNGGNLIADQSFISKLGAFSSSIKNASIYVKTNDGSTKTIFFRIAGAGDLQQKIVTGNWVRIDKNGTSDGIQFGLRGGFGTSDSIDLLVWGAQLTQGSVLKDYLKTTNRLNVPSIDYSLGSDKPALLVEPQRTNIVFPSATATTQTRTVTAQAYTLSFYGTGTVALSGVHTATVIGTGTALKTYTFTPTAGSLTFTITGSVTDWQVEAGSNATSRVVTTTATATRNAYTSFIDLFNNNSLNKDDFTLYFEGYLSQNATTNIMIALSDTTGIGARVNDLGIFDGCKATYAVGGVITSDTVNLSNNNYFKIAIQRNGTSVKFFRNGAQIWNDRTIPVFDYRYLVVNTGGSTYSLQKIALWKHIKSDAECITLTS